MNFLLISDVLFTEIPGGAARVPWELAQALAQNGHSVTLIARTTMKSGYTNLLSNNLKIITYTFSKRSFIVSLIKAREISLREAVRADYIHVHGPFSALLLSFFHKKPYVYYYYSPWHEEYLIRRKFAHKPLPHYYLLGMMRKLLESSFVKKSGKVVILSNFIESKFKQIHSSFSGDIHRVLGGVDVNRFSKASSITTVRNSLKWSNDQIHLLTVRNLEARMGLENLITAIANLLSKYPILHLHIVGEGSLREFLELKCKQNNICQQIQFHGQINDSDLVTFYQAADCFVLPTRELEGFGLVTVEALACGCPVIATPIGATPEILGNFDKTFLANGNSAEDIATALDAFLIRKLEWKDIREKCSIYANQHFSWNSIAEKIAQLN